MIQHLMWFKVGLEINGLLYKSLQFRVPIKLPSYKMAESWILAHTFYDRFVVGLRSEAKKKDVLVLNNFRPYVQHLFDSLMEH
jgi:hypothetical protein